MNTVVWGLVALTNSGHVVHSIVPTLEFTTQQKCHTAIVAFETDAADKAGTARLRCVGIEK